MPNQPQKNPNLSPPYYSEEDTISLMDILLIMVGQLKIILIIPTIFCSITIIHVLFIAEPVYVATAKIMSSSAGDQSQMAGLASQFGISLPTTGQSQPNWVYEDIIKSRTLARAMLRRKFDTKKYGLQKPLLQILTYGDEKPGYGKDTLEILAINSLLGMIELNENIRSTISTLTISANEPQFAADLGMALIEELDAHQQEYKSQKVSETRLFIDDRIQEIEKELNTAEEFLKDFRGRNRRIQNSPALLLEEQRLLREVTVLTSVFTTLKQQLETTKIEEVKESEYVIVLDPPEAPLKRSKPKRKQLVIIAGILGIGLGIIIGFIKEYLMKMGDEDQKKIDQVKLLLTNNIIEIISLGKKN